MKRRSGGESYSQRRSEETEGNNTDLSESKRSAVSLLGERRRVLLAPQLVAVEFRSVGNVVLELDNSRKWRGCGIIGWRVDE